MFTLHYGLHGRQTPKGPSTPEASADSLPPRLLQLLPVETKVTGRDSLPLKNSALARRTINIKILGREIMINATPMQHELIELLADSHFTIQPQTQFISFKFGSSAESVGKLIAKGALPAFSNIE